MGYPDGKLLWFNDPKRGWVRVELHAVDANHALEVDPGNWALEKPAEPEPEPEPDADEPVPEPKESDA